MTRVSFKYWNHRFKDWAAQAKNPALTVPSLWVSSMRKDRTLLDSQKSPALVSFYNFPMLPHSLIICMSAKTKHLSAETSLIVPLVPLSCSRNSISSLVQRAFILDKTFSHGAALRLNLWYCRPITPPQKKKKSLASGTVMDMGTCTPVSSQAAGASRMWSQWQVVKCCSADEQDTEN